MAQEKHLRGSCHCGRIRYVVEVPTAFSSQAEVFFDDTSTSRRAQAAPFAAWLRIPLSWYHSSTYAYFPDETHSSIRRTYLCAPPSSTQLSQRQFCGFCGTHLSNWSEQTRDLAEMIDVTLGSLLDEDLDVLEKEGLLGGDEDGEKIELLGNAQGRSISSSVAKTRPETIGGVRGYSWFEKMGGPEYLGRVRRQTGGFTSEDGSTMVEWEIVEVDGDDTMTGNTIGKRKLDER